MSRSRQSWQRAFSRKWASPVDSASSSSGCPVSCARRPRSRQPEMPEEEVRSAFNESRASHAATSFAPPSTWRGDSPAANRQDDVPRPGRLWLKPTPRASRVLARPQTSSTRGRGQDPVQDRSCGLEATWRRCPQHGPVSDRRNVLDRLNLAYGALAAPEAHKRLLQRGLALERCPVGDGEVVHLDGERVAAVRQDGQ